MTIVIRKPGNTDAVMAIAGSCSHCRCEFTFTSADARQYTDWTGDIWLLDCPHCGAGFEAPMQIQCPTASKLEDMPTSILESAVRVTQELGLQYSAAPHHLVIAKAILAAVEEERAQCAAIAEEYDGDGLSGGLSTQLGDAYQAKREIASAIRARKDQ